MGDAAQLRLKGFPQGRYVRIRFKALPAEFVTNFRYLIGAEPCNLTFQTKEIQSTTAGAAFFERWFGLVSGDLEGIQMGLLRTGTFLMGVEGLGPPPLPRPLFPPPPKSPMRYARVVQTAAPPPAFFIRFFPCA